MDKISIRAATETDLPALAHIEVAATGLFPAADLPPALVAPMALEQLRSSLASSLLWVAEERSRGLVGFCAGTRFDRFLHLLELDVLPSMGRRGIGTMLLRHVCRAASSRGLEAVTLTTFAHLRWNGPFYAKNGFVEVADLAAMPHLADALAAERKKGLKQRIAMATDVRERGGAAG